MQYVNANRLIYTAGQVENAETLLQEKTLQIGLSEVEVCTLKGKSCIILDFGKELSGGAPDSIAGERKDKHTVDGVTTIKHST